MKVRQSNYFVWFIASLLSVAAVASAAKPSASLFHYLRNDGIIRQDTIDKDSADSVKNSTYKKSRRPIVNPKDRYGNPYTDRGSKSPLLLSDPSNITKEVSLDTGNNYIITEKVGDANYRAPSSMTFDEYSKIQQQNNMRNYWQNKSAGLDGESAVTGRSLIPKIYISPVFDRIFGGNYIDIKPNGFVSLDFGVRGQRVNNPAYPIRQQRTPPAFDFDQQISMNVQGKIGEKATITANFDTKSSFQFENNIKFEYTGFEEDIIKKIEVGNVSLPLNNSLIQGAQNLFGIKTQLQFGKLYVTSVASTQRGSREEIKINGGSQRRNFEVRIDNYEDNRHFFLSHFFRGNYENALRSLPNPTSGANIPQNRVEVYIINRANNTETLRNIIGLADLGENIPANLGNPTAVRIKTATGPSDNSVNSLYDDVIANRNIPRAADQVTDALKALGLEQGKDFEKITGARKLTERDYTVNTTLGYISLNTPLRNDESVAVAYQYTYQGRPYKVGELTEDYQDREGNEVIFLKLLRPNSIRTTLPMWNLMMKNIYPLGTSGIKRENFQLRIIYRDDNTGLDNPNLQEGAKTKNVPLVQLFAMDRLNQNNDPQPDGNFDYIEGITIDSKYGRIIFPILQPFGSSLYNLFNESETSLREKYVFPELYSKTKNDASLTSGKNKFFIVGSYEASGAEGVNLNAMGIAQGSVTVSYGSNVLVENEDYTVDYNTGQVTFLKEQYNQPGSDIKISYEKDEFFTPTTKTLLGSRFDYKFNKNLNLGGTILYLSERPQISRISVGDEPTRNMIWGADFNYSKDSRVLTRLVDRLPFIRTKEISNVSMNGEFAQLVPGTSNKNGGSGISYIDDFEGSETAYDLGRQTSLWKLSSTPENYKTGGANDLTYGYKRAKLAWYTIDQTVFYRSTGANKPDNVQDQETSKNHYTRGIGPQEIFKNRDLQNINTYESTFDLAYFPSERGPYNFNPDLNLDGTLKNPKNNWAGITRAITNDIDFDNINVEYIEFWMMDPFIKGSAGEIVVSGTNGINNDDQDGKLIFNLGNISEDALPDHRHMFENGLPPDGDTTKATRTRWGYTPKRQYLNNAFEVGTDSRKYQDVGLDGLSNEEENAFLANDFIGKLPSNIDQAALDQIRSDPSADDFLYFLGSIHDRPNRDNKIIGRYKNFNGQEANSPDVSNTNSAFVPVGTTIPDNEDLNRDNTLNELDAYYQYVIDLKPQNLNLENKYIVDKVIDKEQGNWYLFRIPIREPSSKVGGIEGFKTMRFIRTMLTGFAKPVVLRFLNFQLVSSQWRKFPDYREYRKLREPGADLEGEVYNPSFVVSTVNIEENGPPLDNVNGTLDRTPYVLPPGFRRDRDNSSLRERRLNEQSLRLSVKDLRDGDARAVFKNVNFDFINYKRLKMNIHAETDNESFFTDGDVTAFIRLGTDFFDNYYEIEVPLYLTRGIQTDNLEVWRDENLIDFEFDALTNLKVKRNRANFVRNLPYKEQIGKYNVTVVGNPDYSAVQVVMLGVRNPRSTDNEAPKSITIWANELRVSDFDNTAGWAATARINAKLADFATVSASGRKSTYGFGGLQDRIAERSRVESNQYFVSSNVNLDKFFPQKLGLKVPMFVSYENEVQTPRYDPLDRDVVLTKSLTKFTTDDQKDSYLRLIQDRRVRRSLNFTNVGKVKTNPDAKSHLYDIENLSLTYAYSDEKRSTENIESYLYQTYKFGLAYTYSNSPKYFEPFKKVNFLNSPFFKLIKDFNIGLGPSTITVRGDLDRRFARTQWRAFPLDSKNPITPNYQKAFTFTRTYDLRWNFSKNLALDYTATAYAIIDEPVGEINTQENRDSVLVNLKKLGRMKDFTQTAAATYKLPLDKFPLTDWIDAQVRYSTGYHWMAGAISPSPNAQFYSNEFRSYWNSTEVYGNMEFLGQADTLGNLISNNREKGFVGKINLTTLYNKNKFLKDISAPQRPNTPARPPINRSATAPTNKKDSLEQVQGPKRELRFLKEFFKILMTIKSIDVNYTITDQTTLPGFMLKPKYIGMDEGFKAPGWDFVLGGSQDPLIKNRLAEQGYMAPSKYISAPFEQIRTTRLSLRTQLEPIKDFKIQLDAKRETSDNYQEIFRRYSDTLWTNRPDEYTLVDNGRRGTFNPTRNGNFSISIVSIKTAFDKNDKENRSGAFKSFEQYREIIQSRVTAANPSKEGSYELNSQDVLIPAFLAAYTGQSATSVKLSPFKDIPIPNWRVDYTGLGKMNGLKDLFSSFVINHGYTSTFNIGNFVSAYNYNRVPYITDGYNYPFPTVWDDSSGRFVPFFVMNQISIDEQFSPLIGVNFRTKKRFTGRVDYKMSRAVGLNLSNHQVNEQNRKEISFSLGYITNNFKVPFKVEGRQVVLKNDLNLRCDLTISDTKTIQRIIGDLNTITQGNLNIVFRPNFSYVLNQKLQLQVYFERSINNPKVSSSFKRTTTAFGIQLRFSLAQ